jgi:hypothetical protein
MGKEVKQLQDGCINEPSWDEDAVTLSQLIAKDI